MRLMAIAHERDDFASFTASPSIPFPGVSYDSATNFAGAITMRRCAANFTRGICRMTGRTLKRMASAILAAAGLFSFPAQGVDVPLYRHATAPVEQRVEDLLSRMTL